VIIGSASGIGASVMVGYVMWAFRGASLLFSALAAMPMWKCFDPLPVLSQWKKQVVDDEENQDENELKIQGIIDPGAVDNSNNVYWLRRLLYRIMNKGGRK